MSVKKDASVESVFELDEEEKIASYTYDNGQTKSNIFEDEIFDFTLELEKTYQNVDCYGIEAELCGNMLKVHSEVAPCGMFAIRLF